MVEHSTSQSMTPASKRLPSISTILIVAGILMLASVVAMLGFDRFQGNGSNDNQIIASVDPTSTPEEQSTEVTAEPTETESTPTEEPTPNSAIFQVEEDVATETATPVEATATEPTEEAEETEEPLEMPPPTHLSIPSISVDTEVVEVGYDIIEIEGQRVINWEVASWAAGHHFSSASPGEGGNVVITGHNDWEGEVFRDLEHIENGDPVIVTTNAGEFEYQVEEIHYRREVNVSFEERLATGEFLGEMPDDRVTLITCWPYGVNDHRIIVVAKPVS